MHHRELKRVKSRIRQALPRGPLDVLYVLSAVAAGRAGVPA